MSQEGVSKEEEEAAQGGRVTIAHLISQLDSLGPGASYTACMLRESYKAQRNVIDWLNRLADREEVQLAEMDAMLLRWLHACYLYVSSVPGLSSGTVPLAPIIALAGVLRPFIGVDDGKLMVGIPRNEEVLTESLSELVRLAGAAIVTYHDYLSAPSRADRIPSDDSALLFSTMAIRSCQNELAMQNLSAQIESALAIDISGEPADTDGTTPATLPEPPEFAQLASFGISEIRWLMHWLRSQLSYHFGNVRFVVGDRVGHKENLVAAQQDKLCMLKLVPNNLTSYVLYCRSCLQFQQMKAAHIFASKGLIVAGALSDDAHKAQLLLIHATAAALGGAGPTFSMPDVKEGHTLALEARDACLAWLPESFKDALDLEPELTIVEQKVIAALPDAADNSAVPVLESLYTIPEPSSLPPGAVEEPAEEGEGEGEGQEKAAEGATAGSEAAPAKPAAAAGSKAGKAAHRTKAQRK